jgi:hypothetical protein
MNKLIENGYEVNHINKNKTDNKLENLEVLSRSDHRKKDMTENYRKGWKKISVKSIDLETGEEKHFNSINKASKEYDICVGSIAYCIRGLIKSSNSKSSSKKYRFIIDIEDTEVEIKKRGPKPKYQTEKERKEAIRKSIKKYFQKEAGKKKRNDAVKRWKLKKKQEQEQNKTN